MKLNSLLSNRVVSNSIFILFEKFFTIGITAIVGIYVARYLGPEKFGILNYANSFIGILLPLSRLGLNTIVVRSLVLDRDLKDKILGSSFIIKLFGGILIVLIVLFFVHFSSESETVNFLLTIISLGALIRAFDSLDYFFQSEIKSKYTAYARSIGGLSASIFRVILIINNAPLELFAYSYLIDLLIGSIGMILLFQKKYSSIFKWEFNWDYSKRLLVAGSPLILTGIATSIDLKIDQVMLRHFHGMTHVGQYAAAVRISELWYFVPVAIMSSYFPRIVAQIKSGSFSHVRSAKIEGGMFYASFTVAMISSLFAEEIIRLLYGSEYIGSAEVLRLHIWSAVFVFIGQFMSKVVVARHQQKFLLFNKLISSSVNVCLNLYLIPRYGIVGAASATLVSYGVGHFLVYGIFSSTRDLFYIQINGMLYPFIMLKQWVLSKRMNE